MKRRSSSGDGHAVWVFTLMGLLAKLLSDVSYVLVDPRIHFDGER